MIGNLYTAHNQLTYSALKFDTGHVMSDIKQRVSVTIIIERVDMNDVILVHAK